MTAGQFVIFVMNIIAYFIYFVYIFFSSSEKIFLKLFTERDFCAIIKLKILKERKVLL